MFEGFEIEFNGKKGKVEARRIIELLSILESSPTDPNRVREGEPETFDMARNKVAIVYGRILRFIGLDVQEYDIALKLRNDAGFVTEAYGNIARILTALRPPADYAPQVDPKKPHAETQEESQEAQ